MVTTETCENCGREIGRLETPFLIDEHIVCWDCKHRLSPAQGRPLPVAQPVIGVATCPICGTDRPAKLQSKGSIIVLLFLLCLGVLPGLLYAMLNDGYVYVCPQCGHKRGSA